MKVNQQINQFDYGSDLHVDFFRVNPDWSSIKNPESDVLILAGDMSHTPIITRDVLNDAQKVYKYVLYVDGNHDHYNVQRFDRRRSVSDTGNELFSYSIIDGWTFLPFRDLILGDTVIIGHNAWYDWNAGEDLGITYDDQKNAWMRYIADYRYVNFADGELPDVLAKRGSDILAEKIKEYDANPDINTIIVVTHSIPKKEAVMRKADDIIWNRLNGTFLNSHNENINLLSNKVKYWVFGHTHFEYSFKNAHTQYMCHPRGYPNENDGLDWKPKTVKL